MEQPARDYVEQVGLWSESAGMPRMAGRVLGWLLVCDPPECSAEQLADGLHASRGSISTATRLLVSAGLVERVSYPGDRRTYYRITPDTLTGIMEAETGRIAAMRDLGEQGLKALDATGVATDDPRRRRLTAWVDVARFFERHWPALLEQWREEQRT